MLAVKRSSLTSTSASLAAIALLACVPGAPTDVSGNLRPTASIVAPADGASFATGETVTFRGAATDPEDGTLPGTSLRWISSRDGSLGTGSLVEVADLTDGPHLIRLIATDSDGASDTAAISIGISVPANRRPTATITAPADGAEYEAGASVAFQGGGIDPEDGVLAGASLAWESSLDGPIGTGTGFNRDDLSIGSHEVRLIATDSEGAADTARVAIGVGEPANQGPAADFAFDCTDLSCTFTDGSSDSDGTIVAWAWEFGDGQTSTERNPQHEYAAGGTYTVTLTVTDDDGATDDVSREVTVTPPNQAPTADFSFDCTGLSCTFTDESDDPDGTVVAWSWTFGDGQTSTERNPQHTYADEGTYTVTLTVTDDDGASSGPASRQVTVTRPNEPPTARFGYSCVQLACQFTDASTDPDGTVTAWSWSFGDGATSTVRDPVHLYPNGGTYQVSLEVTDNDGDTDATTVAVTVNRPPTATINDPADGAVESLGSPIQFRGAASDPDGDGLTYLWTSDREEAPLGTSLNVTTSLTKTGEHVISFIASDGIAADTAQVTIRVVQG